jgi:hypothetical protein
MAGTGKKPFVCKTSGVMDVSREKTKQKEKGMPACSV